MLLPFAVQFAHNLEHRHENFCFASDIHIDNHELECEIFHFRVDQNTLFSPLNFELNKKIAFHHKIESFETIFKRVQIHKKSSRAPPSLLL